MYDRVDHHSLAVHVEDVDLVDLTGALVEAARPAPELSAFAVGEVDVAGSGQLDHLCRCSRRS